MDSGYSENSKIDLTSSVKEKYKITVEEMKAKVWKYFNVQKKQFISICKVCKQLFDYFHTTEKMHTHMLRQHLDVLEDENDTEGKLY